MVILIREFLMLHQLFPSTQVKQILIASNKPVYTSCLTSCPEDLKLTILGN